MPALTIDVIKIFFLAALATIVAITLAPFLIRFLYYHQLWRKEARRKTITEEEAPVFYQLHKERETKVPRFGGLLIWLTTLFLALFFFFLSKIFPNNFWLQKFNFLSRSQTWLPLFTLVAASLLGLFDDILQVFGKGGYPAGGITFFKRFLIVTLIGAIGAWWFYWKLGWNTIHIPALGDFTIGIFYVPLFILVMLACWSGGIIDGLNGLAGGTFASIFSAFSIIALSQGKVDLAAFCGILVGTTLAFLWFNIPPAKFYMGETGTLGLSTTLAVIAFLTDSVIVLPIIAGLLVIESGSVILQLFSKKFRKKKIWLCTPIHHHFEAKGWPPYKVTMRFWLIGIVLTIIGVTIRLLG
jgi:phospho-N-acetylmuramoyl-pentapeptide-transferase